MRESFEPKWDLFSLFIIIIIRNQPVMLSDIGVWVTHALPSIARKTVIFAPREEEIKRCFRARE